MVSNFQFLSTNRSVSNDVDGDGKTDLVWHHSSTGMVAVWLMDGATLRQGRVVATLPDLGWQIVP